MKNIQNYNAEKYIKPVFHRSSKRVTIKKSTMESMSTEKETKHYM